jgi:hypothetical protein
MYSRNTLLFLLYGLLTLSHSYGQRKIGLSALEDSLRVVAAEIRKTDKDSLKIRLNDTYLNLMKETLTIPSSFNYPFDSLKTIGKILSPDKKFRIFNWNLPKSDGTNKYFCLIQVKEKKKNKIIELNDVSDSLNDAEFRVLSSGKWYGALYFKIVMNKSGSKVYYSLLGWDGCNPFMYQKVIDVLTFDGRGNPVFGAKIFRKYKKGKNTRVIFTYSSSATMTLRYDEQIIPSGKKMWNRGKKSYDLETRKVRMIVCDQLGALLEPQEGQPVYNVPLGENFDGFLFENGAWNYIQNISAKNN